MSKRLCHFPWLVGEKQISPRFEGVVVEARIYDISPKQKNQIARLHFRRGQVVKKGDLLVEFDTADKRLNVDHAKADHDLANAELSLKQDQFSRAKSLKAKDVVSSARFREAELELQMAMAKREIARVELVRAKMVLREQSIYAPFDGQMSAPRFAENANVEVRAGQEIAKIVQLDPIHVRYFVPYDYFFELKKEEGSEAKRFEQTRFRLICLTEVPTSMLASPLRGTTTSTIPRCFHRQRNSRTPIIS